MPEPLVYLAYLTFSSELVIMPPVESTVPVEFLPSFVDGVRLKRRLPDYPRERKGRRVSQPRGNLIPRR
nr:MAG TPA: hypothetical protein [Bacteriophage sp.]